MNSDNNGLKYDNMLSDLLPAELIEKNKRFTEITESNLIRILRDNANTEAGMSLGFSDIDSVAKYRAGVTLSKYSDYCDFTECMQMGDEDLITSYKLYSFLKTSGTEGTEKLLPLTETALSQYQNYIDMPCININKKYGGKRFMVSMVRADVTKPYAGPKDMLLSGAYYSYQYYHGLMDMNSYAGGEPLFFFHRNCDFLYAKVWLAFTSGEITTLENTFLYDTLLFFRYMEKHFEEIIRCMETRDIPLSVDLPSRVKAALLDIIPDKDRISRIKAECEKGFDNILPRLWPHIKMVSGICSDICDHEEDALKKYTCNVPLWYFSYAASECHIGIPTGIGSKDYMLLPDSAYYEFLPESYTSEPEKWVKTSSEIKIGENYELVLTTFNGLYRYMLGDIVKITGFCGQAPIVRFQYRRNQVLNISGEKIDEKALSNAVNYALNFYRHEADEYFFQADYSETPACYEAFFRSPKELDSIDISYFSRVLDTALRQGNYQYSDLRKLKMIGAIKTHWLTPKEYDKMIDNTGGYSRPVHIKKQKGFTT